MNRVVYTALFGDYDELPSINYHYGVDCFCYTNNAKLKASGWQFIVVENFPGFDNHMMNRYYKVNPHKHLLNYEYSLYIDANVKIINNINILFDKYSCATAICSPLHQDRFCIYDEAKKIIDHDLDDRVKVTKQVELYLDSNYPKNYGLLEMNIIFRRHQEDIVIAIMDEWWRTLTAHSRRDQLSFLYCCWSHGFKPTIMSESSRVANPYFIKFRHKNGMFDVVGKVRSLLRIFYYRLSTFNN